METSQSREAGVTSCKGSGLPSTGFRSQPPLPNQSSALSSLPLRRRRERGAEEALGTDPEGAGPVCGSSRLEPRGGRGESLSLLSAFALLIHRFGFGGSGLKCSWRQQHYAGDICHPFLGSGEPGDCRRPHSSAWRQLSTFPGRLRVWTGSPEDAWQCVWCAELPSRLPA